MTLWLLRLWGVVAIAACVGTSLLGHGWWSTLSWAVQVYIVGGLVAQRHVINRLERQGREG